MIRGEDDAFSIASQDETAVPGAGVELSRAYFDEVVGPLLDERFARMPYAAGRLGSGSDVLGVDDVTSRDHDWGLRLSLFVPRDAVDQVEAALEESLPARFRGFPTRFAFTGQSTATHHVDVSSVTEFLHAHLGFDPRNDPTPRDWLCMTGQAALEVTAGPLFVDRPGDITAARDALSWYPDDVWRCVIAADWRRIDQELPLLSRAGDVGDDRGSRVIAARLVQVCMHLGFLVARRWPPYSKWLGTLFNALPMAGELGPLLDRVLQAGAWRNRQTALAAALDVLLQKQNALGLTSVDRATAPFWNRPYLGVNAEMIPQLAADIRDPGVRALPPSRGSIEQMTDVVDLLVDVAERRRFWARMPIDRSRLRVKSMLIAVNATRTAHAVTMNAPSIENPEGYHRLIGGSVEFGETHHEAIRREVAEELGARVVDLEHVGVVENIFTIDGEAGHEIVFLYAGTLDPEPAATGATLTENDGSSVPVVWRPADDEDERLPLYPVAAREWVQRVTA